MLRAVAFGLAAGAGVQAWRQWPADGPVTSDSGILVMVVGIAAAYLAGLWKGRPHRSAYAAARAEAHAEATANAHQSVNVAVVVPGQGASAGGSQGDGSVMVPLESASWIGGSLRHVEADELDGMDFAELGLTELAENADG